METSILPGWMFDSIHDAKKGKTHAFPTVTANRVIELRSARASLIEIAGGQYKDFIYSETRSNNASVGLPFLERNLATLDFPTNRLYLKPGNQIDHRDEMNMSRIHSWWVENQLAVKTVDVDSTGFAAGIREGDILLELNGRASHDYDPADIRELFQSGDGREVTVTYSRDGVRKTVTFKLRAEI